MTEQQISDLNLAGFFVNKRSNGNYLIEGTTNGIDWIIEEDFDAFWVYEYTGNEYHSIDAFGVLDQALELVRSL
ncbi:hypothetical protein CkP1_0063 [Citrobacter phage CkP1]|nr:hypothetical protein CkP1_0063 [Citrobacter phage CkP1]